MVLILSSLNTYSDEWKKLFLEPKLALEKNYDQVRIILGY